MGDAPKFVTEPGWGGVFTRHEADGALPNGSRVVKVNSEKHDATGIGTQGTILGSLPVPPEVNARVQANPVLDIPNVEAKHFYFIEWDDKPRMPVGCADWKVAAA